MVRNQSASFGDVAPARPRALFVPALPGPHWLVLRMFRTPLGSRTAVAFTSADKLAATLGAKHEFTRLCERALRDLAELQGVTELTLDPKLAAPTSATTSASESWDALDWEQRCVASLSDEDGFDRVGA